MDVATVRRHSDAVSSSCYLAAFASKHQTGNTAEADGNLYCEN